MTLFGYTLRFLRAKKELSCEELGKALGIGPATLENIENGYIDPEDSLAEKIAAYFGVTVGYMQGSVEVMMPPEKAEEDALLSPTRYVRLRPFSFQSSEDGKALRQSPVPAEIVLPLPAGDKSTYIAVQVTDNSMSRYRIFAGDYLVVRDDAMKIRQGDLVLLLSKDGNAIVRLYHREGDTILLRSDMDDLLPPVRLSDCDASCRLVGTVVKIMVDVDADFIKRRSQNPPLLPEELLPPPDMEKQEGTKNALAEYMHIY